MIFLDTSDRSPSYPRKPQLSGLLYRPGRQAICLIAVCVFAGLVWAEAPIPEPLRTKNGKWEELARKWVKKPLDIDVLPVDPFLPDPLQGVDTAGVTPAQRMAAWDDRRKELLALFQKYVTGIAPPRPDNLQAEVLRSFEGDSALLREVELRFGPGHLAKLWFEIRIPYGDGPFPVFITPLETGEWADIALQRGYITVSCANADNRDDTDSFVEAYPGYDWSKLMRRAWATSRCIDYLESVPEANLDQIAIAGHSRYGKHSLIAAAFDTRIAAVISSSSGAGGSMPARYYDERGFGEGLERLTQGFPDWYHPRLRYFAGRENRLPFDFHELVASIAPRACLLSIAYNDGVEDTWAMQQTYLAARPAYEFAGAGDRLRILWRHGLHELWPYVFERYMDWCDLQFGRGDYRFPERLIHPWNWDAWRQTYENPPAPSAFPVKTYNDLLRLEAGQGITTTQDWSAKRGAIREEIRRLLGEGSPWVRDPQRDFSGHTNVLGRYLAVGMDNLLGRSDKVALLGKEDEGKGVALQRLVQDTSMTGYNFGLETVAKALETSVFFGDSTTGEIYTSADFDTSKAKAPAVLFLHGFSSAMGYSAHYKRGPQLYHTLARAGYVVFCFDQIGTARRVQEVEGFYKRFPQWSLLGKMVRDSQAALDAMERIPYVDSKRIFVVGFGGGALVAHHLLALDDRPAGFVTVCGAPPFRTDTADKGTGGIRRWAQLRMLLPQLGFFVGEESRVPYDLDELIACAAPRPGLLISREWDWQCPPQAVEEAVEAARGVYALHAAPDNLKHEVQPGIASLDVAAKQRILDWLNSVAQ